jgi:tetratricopeptide (TPR) repeat protein
MHATSRTLAALLVLASAVAQADSKAEAPGKIPITTTSPEARELYYKGRDLVDKLRLTDARSTLEQALKLDPDFAMAWVLMANSAGSANEFFAAVKAANANPAGLSDGERLTVEALDAGAKGEPERQRELLTKLVKAYPNDERAHNALGGFHFGRQEYPQAIEAYRKATQLAPTYSAPLNQLGYAHRFLGNYAEAEKVFVQYTKLLPDDPNPHDSYAELLMKMGRFEESIKAYEKALAVDPNFVASYLGIANDQMFLERGADARKTLARLLAKARRPSERRAAYLTAATSYVHEGKTDLALAEVEKAIGVARKGKELATIANDLNFAGNILLEAGQADRAAAKFKAQAETLAKSDVPQATKDQQARNARFDFARVALAKNDLATAKQLAAEYGKLVAEKKIPFEVRQSHELLGLIALAEKSYATAVTELDQASTQDPRVQYHLGLALQGKGDPRAKEVLGKVASWNALAGNYAFVRTKAKALLKS